MNTPVRIMAIAIVAGVLAWAGVAQAATTFYFNANQTYTGFSSSPFDGMAPSNFVLEDFEDGLLNVPGVRAPKGRVSNPGALTDSVDSDDGSNDGLGTAGHSFKSGNRKTINFRFQNVAGLGRPTMAGLVWTDGRRNSWVTFRAWANNGDLLGRIRVRLGDLARNGGTSDDRFLGVTSDRRIARIQISSNFAGFEVDHLQFGYGAVGGFAVVPVPPAIGLGAVGLLGVALLRRRKKSAPSSA